MIKNKDKTEKGIEILSSFEKLLEDSKKELTESTINKSPEQLTEDLKMYYDCVIENTDSKSQYDFIVKGLKDIKKIRVGIDNRRKTLTAPATKYSKELIEHAKVYIEPLKSAEDYLGSLKLTYDNLLEAERNRLFTERAGNLAKNGFQLVGKYYVCGPLQIEAEKLGDLDNEMFDYYLDMGKKDTERRKAAEERMAALEAREAELIRREEEISKREIELADKDETLDQKYQDNNDDLPSLNHNDLAEELVELLMEDTENEKVFPHINPLKEAEKQRNKESEKNHFLPKLPQEIGFYDCREKVLEILKKPNSFGKSVANLITKVGELEYSEYDPSIDNIINDWKELSDLISSIPFESKENSVPKRGIELINKLKEIEKWKSQ